MASLTRSFRRVFASDPVASVSWSPTMCLAFSGWLAQSQRSAGSARRSPPKKFGRGFQPLRRRRKKGKREREREREGERDRDEMKEIEKRGRDKAASSPSSRGLPSVCFTSCSSRPGQAFSLASLIHVPGNPMWN